MKYIKSIAIMLFALFFALSCSKSGGGGSTGAGKFPDPNEEGSFNKFDYFISFNSCVELFSSSEVNSCIFKLNNIEIDTDEQWSYDEEEETYYPNAGWWCLFDIEELPEEFDLIPGCEISYYLKINGKAFSGTIMLPYELEVNWPEFNVDEDFTFNWTLQENTNVQFVNMMVGDETNSDEEIWELPNSGRNYTILKSNFQGYNESEIWFVVNLNCINYKNWGKCLVLSYTDDYYWNNGKSLHKSLSRRERMSRILKGLDLK